ncbi:MAG: biotin carboxylase N-terminal domain-containing protein [Rhodospirillales bacterium]
MTQYPFDTVLVANRGEIAARILRTVKALGLRGLVLHHAADTAAPALALADGVIDIVGASPVAAFLDGAQIIEKAVRAGVQAVHPGYGFLSENAGFCRAVAEAGMVFVGPGADAIDLMGDKVRARAFVAARGFPVAPSAIEDDDPGTFAVRARALNVPLLIKRRRAVAARACASSAIWRSWTRN